MWNINIVLSRYDAIYLPRRGRIRVLYVLYKREKQAPRARFLLSVQNRTKKKAGALRMIETINVQVQCIT